MRDLNDLLGVGCPYLSTIMFTVQPTVTSFYLDIYNGQVFNVNYTMSDNQGDAASFLLAPNLASGSTARAKAIMGVFRFLCGCFSRVTRLKALWRQRFLGLRTSEKWAR